MAYKDPIIRVIYRKVRSSELAKQGVNRTIFRAIIMDYLTECLNTFDGEHPISLHNIGLIELRSLDCSVKFINGEVQNKHIIDWKATKELSKSLGYNKYVYCENNVLYRSFFNRYTSKVKYTQYMTWKASLKLKSRIKKLVSEGNINCYQLWKK